MKPLDKRLWHNKLRSIAYQKVFFSNIEPLDIAPLYEFENRENPYFSQQVILVSGIGNPRPFIHEAETRYTVVEKIIFPDHHRFTADDLKRIYAKLNEHPRAFILTTEKDAVRLRRARMPESMMRVMYYQPIAMYLVDGPEHHDFVSSLIAEIEYKERNNKRGKNNNKSIVDEED
jgi:tetraacyldisaccharide 4'-kinase